MSAETAEQIENRLKTVKAQLDSEVQDAFERKKAELSLVIEQANQNAFERYQKEVKKAELLTIPKLKKEWLEQAKSVYEMQIKANNSILDSAVKACERILHEK